MVLTLVIDQPFLANGIIWLISVDVFSWNHFVSINIHSVSRVSVLESLGGNIIVESLVMKTSPVVNNHVVVETFKESSSWKSNRFKRIFFSIPCPLL